MFVTTNTYSVRAPTMKRRQKVIQTSMAVRPSALGKLMETVLKMLTMARIRMTRNVVLPVTMEGGIRNEIQEAITRNPDNDD